MKFIFQKLASSGGDPARIKAVLLVSLGIYALMVLALSYAWYSNQWAASFHFFDDAAEWKQMDKFAHFFWTFQVCAVASRLFRWARVDDRMASWAGTFLGFVFVSGIEVGDGLSLGYGASLFDILANGFGAAAFILQKLIWKKINIWPKFSFHPTAFAPLRPEMLGGTFLEQVLKDYNGQTFWYSVSFKKIPLPSWLTIAVGVGAEGMVFARDYENELMNFSPHRKYFLSLDLNLTQVKTSSKVFNSLLYVFTIFKTPAPAIEVSTEGIRFHPIYW